jgi:type II secretory pathway pseudopilin PulG
MATENQDTALRTPIVLAALLVLAVLAAVPFAAVRTLHSRRISAADTELRVLASQLRSAIAQPVDGSHGILVGSGSMPEADDQEWLTATRAPLAAIVTFDAPDPWGNAYVVNTGAQPGDRVWVLSAGPNGRIDTPFRQPSAVAAPAGDDRATPLR